MKNPSFSHRVFVCDTLNFSFWPEDSAEKCVISYKGKDYTGYWALCAAVNRAIDVSDIFSRKLSIFEFWIHFSGGRGTFECGVLLTNHGRTARSHLAARQRRSHAAYGRARLAFARDGTCAFGGGSFETKGFQKSMRFQPTCNLKVKVKTFSYAALNITKRSNMLQILHQKNRFIVCVIYCNDFCFNPFV